MASNSLKGQGGHDGHRSQELYRGQEVDRGKTEVNRGKRRLNGSETEVKRR